MSLAGCRVNASGEPSPQWLPLPVDEAQGFSSLSANFFDHLSSKYTKSCPTPGPLHLLFQMLDSLLCVPPRLTPSPSGSLSSGRGLSFCPVWRVLPITGMLLRDTSHKLHLCKCIHILAGHLCKLQEGGDLGLRSQCSSHVPWKSACHGGKDGTQ